MPLPQQLIQFKSSDKEWRDKEPDMKDYANMPSPPFIVISGPTNCGKSSVCKNFKLLLSLYNMEEQPPYKKRKNKFTKIKTNIIFKLLYMW